MIPTVWYTSRQFWSTVVGTVVALGMAYQGQTGWPEAGAAIFAAWAYYFKRSAEVRATLMSGMLANPETAPVVARSGSIGDALKYLNLALLLASEIERLKAAPSGEENRTHPVRTRLFGRMASVIGLVKFD